jgi:hypothetical protein
MPVFGLGFAVFFAANFFGFAAFFATSITSRASSASAS